MNPPQLKQRDGSRKNPVSAPEGTPPESQDRAAPEPKPEANSAIARRPLSVAPMMEWTDRDFRYFFRQISRRAFLYTEMVTTAAILHGDRELLLGFSELEKPLALQLGGDNPADLARCARIAQDFGYDEVNLNVGCPSDRVQSGNFGACLMARPELVAECVAAMRAATHLPVSVKHRIGIDRGLDGRALDRYEDLQRFVSVVSGAGCERFIVHARIAVLGGLSPRENREIPPLRYDDVFQLKRDFPELLIEINGGVRELTTARELLARTDGVMIGRAAYETPWIFQNADRDFYPDRSTPSHSKAGPVSTGQSAARQNTRRDVLEAMIPHLAWRLANGRRQHQVLRHMMGLFAGERGARAFRRAISEREYSEGDPESTIRTLCALIDPEILNRPATQL